jgi:hypothetical protein
MSAPGEANCSMSVSEVVQKLSKAFLPEFHTTDLVSQIFPLLADLCVPLDPTSHAERGKSITLCKEKVSGRPSRRVMTDASCDHSLLDLMHVRHDHSATPVLAPASGGISTSAGKAVRARTKRRSAVESAGPSLHEHA